MSGQLSPETISIIKATVPALEAHGLEVVKAMYARLFVTPQIKALFNHSHQQGNDAQPKALAGAVLAYARYIDTPEVLASAIERITQKHVSLQILEEHYPYVADALLGAIADVLGEAATPEVIAAWGEAYWFLANILISLEKKLYDAKANAQGGWRGWRNFVVSERQVETPLVTSFILKPKDGGPVLRHQPGQYLAFNLDIAGREIRRNYSISSEPNETSYRISVKREAQGVASGWLHDHATVGTALRVAPPAGDFYYKPVEGAPLVLISAGVGITPMLSILGALPSAVRPKAQFLHAARDAAFVPHKTEVQSSGTANRFFFADLEAGDAPELTAGWLCKETPIEAAQYYICGPKGFMAMAINGLKRAGVSDERIHYEFFGPATDLAA